MRTIHIAGKELHAQGSPWAVFLYQREFSTADEKCSWYEDYERSTHDFEPVEDKETNVVNSVSALDSMFCLKTLWACVAAVDETVAARQFEPWLKELSTNGEDVPMTPFSLWKLEVSALINAEIFCYRAKEETPQEG